MSSLKNMEEEKLSTAVYVDYECWKYGLYNQYGQETDIGKWFLELKGIGQIDELHFFGDFKNPLLSQDIPKLRTLTNDIIDCSNPDSEKDYTDFIILDRIYQCAMKNEKIKQYIIFSGDGHFSNVVAFLKNFKDKIVGVYAVAGTLSPQLEKSASWCQLIYPTQQDFGQEIQKLLENFRWTDTQNGLFPTFTKTIDIVTLRNQLSRPKVTAALKYLIDQKYVTQEERQLQGNDKSIRVLVPNWTLLKLHGLWSPTVK